MAEESPQHPGPDESAHDKKNQDKHNENDDGKKPKEFTKRLS